MENRLSQDLIITCYDADSTCQIKPASFMDLAQEIANRHAAILGFGYDDMIRTRSAWVLSRMHIHFNRHPLWREAVRLTTWHKGAERLFYLRDFRMTDQDGNPLVSATSSWLIINMDTRKISRDSTIFDYGSACYDNALEKSCDKVVMPAGTAAEKVSEHRIAYSDMDMNGHTNNARYIVWAMDSIDYGFLCEHKVKDLRINFNHETKIGDTVEIFSCEAEGRTYVEGKVADRSAFCAEFTWE